MSTRCNIYLKLNDNDKYQTIVSDNKRLTLNGNYIGIYCHHDGYLTGVGEELITFYNDYNKALGLIIPGDCSTIINNSVLYYTSYGDDYERVKPKFMNDFPTLIEDYLYVFFNNEWHVYSERYNGELVKDILNFNKNGQ